MNGLRKPFPHREFEIEIQLSPMEVRERLIRYAGRIGAKIALSEWKFSMSLHNDNGPSVEISGSIGLRGNNTVVIGGIYPPKRGRSMAYIILIAAVGLGLLLNILSAVGSGMWRAAAAAPVSAVLGYFGWRCMWYLPEMHRIHSGIVQCLTDAGDHS